MYVDETRLYTASYFGRHYEHDPKRDKAYIQESARVKTRLTGSNLLDIGCGTGGFLAQFDPLIYTRYGVDLSLHAVTQTQARGIWAEMPGVLEDFENNFFDCVIMRGTLQHYQQPFEMLSTAHRVLKPDGLLAILATPNTNSLCYKLFNELPALDPPRNWWLPSDTQTANVLNNLGFIVDEVLYPYWGGPYADPPRDFLKFLMRLFGKRTKFAFPGNMMEIYARKNDV